VLIDGLKIPAHALFYPIVKDIFLGCINAIESYSFIDYSTKPTSNNFVV
jgi:hypothetical protein